jgi:hypothetical protein
MPEARARLAQAAADGMDAARKPQVDLDAGAVGANGFPARIRSIPLCAGHVRLGQVGHAGFSWDLDLWGGKRDAWEASLGRSRAAQIDAYAARIQLSVNVARAYVRLGYAFAEQDVADAERQRADTSLGLTRRLVGGGLGTTATGVSGGLAGDQCRTAKGAGRSRHRCRAQQSFRAAWTGSGSRTSHHATAACSIRAWSRCRTNCRRICWGDAPIWSPRAGRSKPLQRTSRRPKPNSFPTSASAPWLVWWLSATAPMLVPVASADLTALVPR